MVYRQTQTVAADPEEFRLQHSSGSSSNKPVYLALGVCVCVCVWLVGATDSQSTQRRRPWYPVESVVRLEKSWPERSAMHLTAAHAHCWTGTEQRYSADTHTHTEFLFIFFPLQLICNIHPSYSLQCWTQCPAMHMWTFVSFFSALSFSQCDTKPFEHISPVNRHRVPSTDPQSRGSGASCQLVRSTMSHNITQSGLIQTPRSTAGLNISPY